MAIGSDSMRGHRLDRRQVFTGLAGAAALPLLPLATSAAEAQTGVLIRYPATLDRTCRTGSAQLFDECGSQVAIFSTALRQANLMGRTLLVSFGAEWCIWCHVFEAYVTGQHGWFDYEFEGQRATLNERAETVAAEMADALRGFVEENFVIAHIEGKYAPDGDAVLERTGAAPRFDGGLPFIFSVTARGRWAASFDYQNAEIRREGQDWYRGYDRTKLLLQLKEMRERAARA